MGRRLSDDYPYIGYVRIPPVVTSLDYDESTGTLSLINNNGSVLSTDIFIPSEYVYKMAGDWDMEGSQVPAYPSRALSASFSGSGPFAMYPASTIPNIGSTCIVATDDGISTTGTGIVWSKITVPSISVGDNLYYYTVHLGSSNSALLDQIILLTGGVPSNSVWGSYVTFDGTGFSSFSVIGSAVTNNITHVFSTTPVAGDSIYVGIDYDNSKIVVQHESNPIIDASPITLTNMPASETFFWGLSMQFTSNTPVFAAGTVSFEPGTSDSGKAPITVESSATPPVDAEEGKQYRVTSSGKYNGYELLVGDFVTFYNGLNDLIITRLGNPELPQIPPGVSDLTYDPQAEQLILERIHSDGSVDYLTATIDSGGDVIEGLTCDSNGLITLDTNNGDFTAQVPVRAGIVIIEDITPTSGLDNVSNKVFTDDGFVLQSCLSNTSQVTVQVLASTGSAMFKPSVTANGSPVTLSRVSLLSDLWRGTVGITLSGSPPYTVTAIHSEGIQDICTVEAEDTPTVTNAYFSGAYSQGAGQTKHAQGQTLSLTVESPVLFQAIDIVNASGNALTSGITSFTAATSKTITVSVADRGNVDQVLPAIIRIQNTNGTWSVQYSTNSFSTVDGVGTLVLNNTRPVLSLGAVTYPVGQSALKESESATVAATYTNVDSVVFDSPNSELYIAPLVTLSNPSVTRIAGGYNITDANLRGIVSRVDNATTHTATKVVNIADTPATISSISKPSRLRSGYVGTDVAGVVHNGATHSIGVSLTQRTLSFSMTSPIGVLQGTQWSTADSGVTYTRSLKIVDSDIKAQYEFDTISITNLAGIVTTHSSIPSITKQFVVGGFTQRTVAVTAWTNGLTADQREAFIGTEARDSSKLLVTIGSSQGIYTNSLSTYTSPSNPATTNYAITGPSGVLNPPNPSTHVGGSYVYVRDTLLASGNASGTLPVLIEETI